MRRGVIPAMPCRRCEVHCWKGVWPWSDPTSKQWLQFWRLYKHWLLGRVGDRNPTLLTAVKGGSEEEIVVAFFNFFFWIFFEYFFWLFFFDYFFDYFFFEYFLSRIEFVRCSAYVFVLLRLETVDLIRTVDIHMLLAAAVYAFFLYGGLVLKCDLANRIQVPIPCSRLRILVAGRSLAGHLHRLLCEASAFVQSGTGTK